jgi:hypothetical protein
VTGLGGEWWKGRGTFLKVGFFSPENIVWDDAERKYCIKRKCPVLFSLLPLYAGLLDVMIKSTLSVLLEVLP